MRAARGFVAACEDCVPMAPVHPNPEVGRVRGDLLGAYPRAELIAPLGYHDFLALHCTAMRQGP